MPSPIAVCFGGPSPEHDISVLTGLQIARVAAKQGHEVVTLYWSKTGSWHHADGDLEAAEGPPEEEVGLTPYATPAFDPGPPLPDGPTPLPMPSFPMPSVRAQSMKGAR